MKKKTTFIPLKLKIIAVMSVTCIFLAVVIAFFSWSLTSKSFQEYSRQQLMHNTQSVYAQVKDLISSVHESTTSIIQTGALDVLTKPEDHSDAELSAASQQLQRQINSALHSRDKSSPIQFVNIYLKNGYTCTTINPDTLVYNDYDSCYDAVIRQLSGSADSYIPTVWVDNATVLSFGEQYHCMVGIRFLYEEVTLRKIGVCVIGISEENMATVLSNLPADSYLVRNDGLIIFSSNGSEIGRQLGDDRWISAYTDSENTSNLTLISDGRECMIYRLPGSISWFAVPIDGNIYDYGMNNSLNLTQYKEYIIIVTILALFLSAVLILLFSRGLTRSLNYLQDVVSSVYSGKLSARFNVKPGLLQADEVTYIGEKFNDMMEQIEDFFHTQERDAAEKRALELRLMQSQINPHLLYNTLNSVVWIIRQKDNEKAEKLVISLASFFKLTLAKGSDIITLADELRTISFYLEIQNIGRGKAFVLQDKIPEEYKSLHILRMLLQPLVENAVIHGFTDWRDDGKITLSAETDMENNALRLCVQDNGIGIIQEELDALLTDIHTYPPKKEHPHYGLYNVDRRIKNRYGNSYGLTIESEIGSYTKVIVSLPLEELE